MTRTETYLNAHPEMNELFETIQAVRNSDNVTVSVITGTPNVKVLNKLENPTVGIQFITANDIDQPTLIIIGRKTYSFGLDHMKISCIESNAEGSELEYRIKFSHLKDEYEVLFQH